MTSLAAIILTYNEEAHIARAITSLRQSDLADEIYVIDSYSSDNTRLIAQSLGATVVEHPFINQAKQFQWALDNLPIDSQWIMRLDADEIVYADLAAEIAKELRLAPLSVGGFTLNRRHVFLGKWIRFGGRYPLRLLRIWRAGNARVEDRWMDEHVVLKTGNVVNLNGRFEDRNLGNLDFFTLKHNKYASREALEILSAKYGLSSSSSAPSRMSKQTKIKRLIKDRVYNHLPYQLTSSAYFLFRFFVQGGFLDGPRGLVYHFLQGYWYRFLVGAKVSELEDKLRMLPDLERRRSELAEFAQGLAGNSSSDKSH